ncbi:MAG TPA: Xaa-Pro aminopeptidase [Gammaproteobacteria bacterium]|jgi:Xaa-Pro aminopeptidase|nr:Xaa-Pro aminopeptidase [Gammaproteobacteria bacterium]
MIKMTEYAKRRKSLMKEIGPSGIIILPSAEEAPRNADALYHFRQNSDFYYLTGFNEPEAVAVLAPGRKEGEYILFNRVRDRSREIWDGPRAGQDGARKEFLADQAFPIEELEDMLSELLSGRDAVHYPLGTNRKFDKMLTDAVNRVRAQVRGGAEWPTSFCDITPTIQEMRIFKSADELALMRHAAEISARAHMRAMQVCKPGMHEYELEAELMHEFISSGARFAAYNSIVGSGHNSCVLHYISNDRKIHKDDLVLIDAGCEYQNYASDITRTFPASGKFSPEQREIYNLVLESQLAAVKAVKPGASWTAPQDIIVKVLTQGLIDLGILKGKLDSLIERQAYMPFYMHRSGHFLGLDVHDCGRYRINNKWRKLEPGMVLTVEPGLYISADIPGVHKRWHNIGVRIEDDVAVTAKGNEILSKNVPKSADDIEAIMSVG